MRVPGVSARLGARNPIAALAVADVLQDAAVFLDGCPGPGIVYIAGDQDRGDSQLAGEGQGVFQGLGGMSAAPRRRAHAVTDVPALVEEEIVQFVPDGYGADDGFILGDPQVRTGNISGFRDSAGQGLGTELLNESAKCVPVLQGIQRPVVSAGTVPVRPVEFGGALEPGGVKFFVRTHKGSHAPIVVDCATGLRLSHGGLSGRVGPAETSKASAVEHHRLAARGLQPNHPGNDQEVVPAVELTLNGAVDPSQRTVNAGCFQC